jgi:hypothetical protein
MTVLCSLDYDRFVSTRKRDLLRAEEAHKLEIIRWSWREMLYINGDNKIGMSIKITLELCCRQEYLTAVKIFTSWAQLNIYFTLLIHNNDYTSVVCNPFKTLLWDNFLLRYIGLWRWYINININIMDIIHRLVFNLKHDVSETGFCLRSQVEPTQFGPTDEASFCLRSYCDHLSMFHQNMITTQYAHSVLDTHMYSTPLHCIFIAYYVSLLFVRNFCDILRVLYMTDWILGAEPFLRGRQSLSHSRLSQFFMEPGDSLPRSEEPSTGSYPGQDKFNPHRVILFLYDPI